MSRYVKKEDPDLQTLVMDIVSAVTYIPFEMRTSSWAKMIFETVDDLNAACFDINGKWKLPRSFTRLDLDELLRKKK